MRNLLRNFNHFPFSRKEILHAGSRVRSQLAQVSALQSKDNISTFHETEFESTDELEKYNLGKYCGRRKHVPPFDNVKTKMALCQIPRVAFLMVAPLY